MGFDRVAVAAELLRDEQAVRLTVRGYSMRPLIPDGTTLELEPIAPHQLQLGDIILTYSQHPTFGAVYIIHRLLSLRKAADNQILVTTRGDAVFELDPNLTATPETIFGRVVAVELNAHRYDYKSKRWRILNRVLARLSSEQITRLLAQERDITAPTLTSEWQRQRRIIERKLYSKLFNSLRHFALKYF